MLPSSKIATKTVTFYFVFNISNRQIMVLDNYNSTLNPQ